MVVIRWLQDDRWLDLLVNLDDATSEIYYAQLVEDECTQTGIQMIPAYSPQARGRGERSFSTWQGRLRQELRLRGVSTVEGANTFLRQEYIQEFNSRFTVPAAQPGTAFVAVGSQDLDRIFSIQHERTVNNNEWQECRRVPTGWLHREALND